MSAENDGKVQGYTNDVKGIAKCLELKMSLIDLDGITASKYLFSA